MASNKPKRKSVSIPHFFSKKMALTYKKVQDLKHIDRQSKANNMKTAK